MEVALIFHRVFVIPKGIRSRLHYSTLEMFWKQNAVSQKNRSRWACAGGSMEVALTFHRVFLVPKGDALTFHRGFLVPNGDQLPGCSLKGSTTQISNSSVSQVSGLHGE
jgi:hypothetical protein